MEYAIGQELFWVDRMRKTNRHVTVKKIGRKWVYLSNHHRIDRKTMEADGRGYSSPGKCYPSQQDYFDFLNLINEWSGMKREFDGFYPPKGMTLDKISQIRNILETAKRATISQN